MRPTPTLHWLLGVSFIAACGPVVTGTRTRMVLDHEETSTTSSQRLEVSQVVTVDPAPMSLAVRLAIETEESVRTVPHYRSEQVTEREADSGYWIAGGVLLGVAAVGVAFLAAQPSGSESTGGPVAGAAGATGVTCLIVGGVQGADESQTIGEKVGDASTSTHTIDSDAVVDSAVEIQCGDGEGVKARTDVEGVVCLDARGLMLAGALSSDECLVRVEGEDGAEHVQRFELNGAALAEVQRINCASECLERGWVCGRFKGCTCGACDSGQACELGRCVAGDSAAP